MLQQLCDDARYCSHRVTPLFSMRTGSLASSQSCCSIDADAWCKRALKVMIFSIWYQCGCKVIATTRFPHGAAKMFAQESDYSTWADRLIIYPLDLKNAEGTSNLVRGGSLKSLQWLLLAFCPKILGGGGDL